MPKLRESGWNISAAAAAIGTPRSNLYKLEAYAISRRRAADFRRAVTSPERLQQAVYVGVPADCRRRATAP